MNVVSPVRIFVDGKFFVPPSFLVFALGGLVCRARVCVRILSVYLMTRVYAVDTFLHHIQYEHCTTPGYNVEFFGGPVKKLGTELGLDSQQQFIPIRGILTGFLK